MSTTTQKNPHELALRAVTSMGGLPLSSSDVHEMTGLSPVHAHAVLLDLSDLRVVTEIRGPYDTPLFYVGERL